MLFLRRINNKAGTSLIEVLVALVIFLVGILSVVRMFPGGFVIVKQGESVTLAKHLAQAEIERWKDRAANLPSGILPWGWDGVIETVLPDMDPEDLRDDTAPPGKDIRYYTDVNKFRYIHAEATEIPAPTPVFPSISQPYIWNEQRSIYVLGFSPVEPGSIMIYSGPMRRRPLARDTAYLNLKSTADYAIDYSKAKIYVRSDPVARNLVITYSYWFDSGDGQTPKLMPVVSQSITVPAGSTVIDIPNPGTPPPPFLGNVAGFRGIEPGSDSLHRAFTPKGGGGWSSVNPYEYELIDEVAGVIAFNPHGYGYDEDTVRGRMPLVANIDYLVADWHIISEEREASDSGVKLSLRFIKEHGRTEGYDGLYPPGGLTCSVLAVDMDTGEVYDESSALPSGGLAFTVNYKDGIIQFNSDLNGHKFRISYQAEDDWAVQVYKAFDTYHRCDSTSPDHRQYYINGNTIGFRQCNAGRMVAVDYVYRLGGQNYTVTGQMFQIPKMDSNPGPLYYIDMTTDMPVGAVLEKVSKVRGVTVGAKVIWRDSGRGFSLGKWKKADLQTYLTRTSK